MKQRREHGDRREGGRAEKGRVFYVTPGGIIVAFVVVHVPPLPDHGHRKTSSANRTGAGAGRRRPATATAAFDVRRHQGLSKVWQM